MSKTKNLERLVDEVIIEFKDHIDKLSLRPEIDLEEKVNTLLGSVTHFKYHLSSDLKNRLHKEFEGPPSRILLTSSYWKPILRGELTEYAKEHPRTKEYCDEQYEERHAPETATKRRKLAVSKMIGRQGDTEHRYSSTPISKDLASLITKQLDSITSERSADRAGSRNKKSRKKKEQKKRPKSKRPKSKSKQREQKSKLKPTKDELVRLAKKYYVTYKGKSKRQIAKNLCDLRQAYMTKKERLYIMPLVPNNVNKKIMKKHLNDKPKKLPK